MAPDHRRTRVGSFERALAARRAASEGDPLADGEPVTLARALRTASLAQGLPDVLVGGERLSEPIRWVSVVETPRMRATVRAGDLVLTTGPGLGRDADAQVRCLVDLAERCAAAVVVQLDDAVERLSTSACAEAERRELPLVALRRPVSFADVTEVMHTAIVNRRCAVLDRGEGARRALTALALRDGGVAPLLRGLADTIGNPVVLEDGSGRMLTLAAREVAEVELLATWRAWRETPFGRPSGDVAAVHVGLGRDERPGLLLALGIESPLDDADHLIVRHAADVVALALLGERRRAHAPPDAIGELLAGLADGRISPENALARADAGGVRWREALLVAVVARVELPGALVLVEESRWSVVERLLRTRLEADVPGALVAVRAPQAQALVVAPVGSPAKRASVAGAASAAIRATVGEQLGEQASVVVAAGAAVDWRRLGEELRGAAESTCAARGRGERAWHDVAQLEVDRLVWRWRGDDGLRALVQGRLGPLLTHDRQRKHQLLPTLEAFCANGGNKAETARDLLLGRQALYARLERIEQMLELRLDDPETLFALQLAIRALRHLRSPESPAGHIVA